VAVSFIGGGNCPRVPGENHRPVTSHWQTLSQYTWSWTGFELTTYKWWQALIAQVVVNPSTVRSRPRRSLALGKDLVKSYKNTQLTVFLYHFWNILRKIRCLLDISFNVFKRRSTNILRNIGSRKSSYFQRPISDEPIKPLGIYQHDGFKDVYF
jgi:hypothetical protein